MLIEHLVVSYCMVFESVQEDNPRALASELLLYDFLGFVKVALGLFNLRHR